MAFDIDLQRGTARPAIAIVGAGSIGTAFAVLHAAAGRQVTLFDESPTQRESVRARVDAIAADLREYDLLPGDAADLSARIDTAATLEEAVQAAGLVHECAPEDLDIKRQLAARLDTLVPGDVPVASASSAITCSEFATELATRSRFLVAHPGNPPFLIRVVEIVPAPFTDPSVAASVSSLLEEAGMTPVSVRREIKGFVFNRLQGALLREAYCLVRDGVASVEDIDRLVRDGLGLRWSVVGPFETVDLNTRGGIARHAAVMGPAYEAMGAERGQHDPWTGDLVRDVEAQRRQRLSLDAWQERVRWRDRRLMSLLALRSSWRN